MGSVGACLRSGGRMRRDSKMSGPSEKQTSLPLTSSAGVFRARIFPLREEGGGCEGNAAGSGTNSPGSSASSARVSSSSRTSRTGEHDGCPRCGLNCTTSGTATRLISSPRAMSAPLTDAIGASLLPTPTASRYGSSQNGDPHDGRDQYAGKGKPSLWTMATRGELPGHPRGPLSPLYLEWMMGFPPGYTDVPSSTESERSATPSSPRSRKRSGGA